MMKFLFILITFLIPGWGFSDDIFSTKEIAAIYNKTYQYSINNGMDSIFYEKLNDFKNKLDTYTKQKEYNDTIMHGYIFYAYAISNNKPIESIKLGNNLLKIVEKENINSVKPNVMHLLAKLYYSQGLINKALKIYRSTSNSFKINNDSIGYAYSLIDIGNVYFKLKEYETANHYYQKSEEVFKKYNGDEKDKYYGLAVCNNNYGLIYSKKQNYLNALKYFNKALKQREQYDLISVIPHSYYFLGDTYKYLGKNDSSKYYFLQAIKVSKDNNIINQIPVSYFKYGQYLADNKPDSALYYLKKSMILSDKYNLVSEKMQVRNAIGEYYIKRDIDTAEIYFKELFEIAKNANNIDMMKNSAKWLVELYQKKVILKTNQNILKSSTKSLKIK